MTNYYHQTISFLQSRTGKLALTYLAIIVSMTLIFSGIIYSVAASQFDRPLRPKINNPRLNLQRPEVEQILKERAQDARMELITSLLSLNLISLFFGALLSYYLARKTLHPIEQALEAQSQFVSDASHELRTPLTALQVTNEVALRKKKLELQDAKELIAYNLDETIKLRMLTNSLLGLVKEESATKAKNNVDLHDVAQETIDSLSSLAEQKKITIDNAVAQGTLHVNKKAITQVLGILLDNAIKYSPSSSRISLYSTEKNGQYAIHVRDQGEGIAKKHQTKIFDRFYRVDESRSSTHTQGTGLGLAIAQTICQRQNMQLSIATSSSDGTTFTFIVSR